MDKTKDMKFGDLIEYDRTLYQHFAVYTGKNEEGQHTTVEFTGEKGLHSKAGATVKKGLLETDFKIKNQLHGETALSEPEMRANVDKVLRDGIGKYKILENNCEHLATFIRYGEAQSLQANRVINEATNLQINLESEIADTFGAPSFGSIDKKFK